MKALNILVYLFCIVGFSIAQTPEEEKAWMEYMTPSDVHKMLAKNDGVWNTEQSMWMEPGKPPIQTKGTATNTMILGGRYQQTVYLGDFMGTRFEGLGTLAFDNAKKEFISTWIDNFGTGIMILKGKYDEKTKSIQLKGTMTTPNGGDIKVREVFTFINDSTQKLEMYFEENGKEFKSMEIIYNKE